MLSLGKKVRLSRLFDRRSGRMLVATIDQGITRGPMRGIEDARRAIGLLVEGRPNAITMHKGLAERCFYEYADRGVALILKASSFAPYHELKDAWLARVDEAVRLGADAIALGVLVGFEGQVEMLETLAQVSREAALAGMPVVVHSYPKGLPPERQHDWQAMAYAARAAAELGADVVKTWWTGAPDTFARVVEACPVPVVIAGGPKLDDPRAVLGMVSQMVASGAAGLAFGRNVWGYHDPVAMLRALRILLHEGGTVAEAEAALGAPAAVAG